MDEAGKEAELPAKQLMLSLGKLASIANQQAGVAVDESTLAGMYSHSFGKRRRVDLMVNVF